MSKSKKELVFIGLGRMGKALCLNLIADGFTVHAFDIKGQARDEAKELGITTYALLGEAISAQKGTTTVLISVPPQRVEEVLTSLRKHLSKGDCIIDTSSSFFKESVFRHHEFDGRGITFIDCGISGGVEDAKVGIALMVGGDESAVKKYKHVFVALAEKDGFGYVGGPGAGHFVKMVQDGIEYGMIGAIAEGINVLQDHKDGMQLNINEALKAYEHGSIIEGNLMSWLADAYESTDGLLGKKNKVPKGETEPEMEYLVDHNHLRVLSAALTQRKLTRTEPSFTGTVIKIIREQFGNQNPITKIKSVNLHTSSTKKK